MKAMLCHDLFSIELRTRRDYDERRNGAHITITFSYVSDGIIAIVEIFFNLIL
jgi:hypothetical protein